MSLLRMFYSQPAAKQTCPYCKKAMVLQLMLVPAKVQNESNTAKYELGREENVCNNCKHPYYMFYGDAKGEPLPPGLLLQELEASKDKLRLFHAKEINRLNTDHQKALNAARDELASVKAELFGELHTVRELNDELRKSNDEYRAKLEQSETDYRSLYALHDSQETELTNLKVEIQDLKRYQEAFLAILKPRIDALKAKMGVINNVHLRCLDILRSIDVQVDSRSAGTAQGEEAQRNRR